MGNTVERPIEAVAWMERSLENSVSTVYIDDMKIIGGDWNGMMICWSREGDILWETNLGDRVAGIRLSTDGAMLWCIAGREAIGIDYENGSIKWNIEFDGSTDLIELDGENRAWIVSSVYDIELNDFMESAISLIDSGDIVEKYILDERPWSIHPFEEGKAFFGLGRPKTGVLELTEKNGKLMHKHNSIHDSPVLCGSHLPPFYLGHSNGMITQIDEKGNITNLKLNKKHGSAIIDISSNNEQILICLENKQIICLNKDGEEENSLEVLDSEGHPEFLDIIDGSTSDGLVNFWIVTSTNNGSLLINANRKNESSNIKLKIKANSRIRDIANAKGMTVVGLDDGRIIAIEEKMLTRRIRENEKSDEEGDVQRFEMLERLRKLRE